MKSIRKPLLDLLFGELLLLSLFGGAPLFVLFVSLCLLYGFCAPCVSLN